jgi:LysR family transcriptional regulator, glycine cleavage system transcriptional activator
MDSKRRRHGLSLDLLKGFEAAARHLSFTRAAEELCLTQSAISREIKSLEEELGQPLFVRVHRGLRLTDAGQVLHRAVGEALNLIDDVTGRLAAAQSAETLAVTTSAALASTWLVPKLPSFFRLHPGVDVRCVSVDYKLDLERERLDLAIRWLPGGSSLPGGERLFDVQRFPVCAPALARDASRPLAKPADLARHVLLDLETTTDHGLWSDWAPWLDAMDLGSLKPAGAIGFSHYDQVVQAAIDGSGVAIGRNPHNARHLCDGLLVAPLGPEATLGWGSYYVLTASRARQRHVVQEFVAWLREEVRLDAEDMRHPTPSRAAGAARRAGRGRVR